MNLISLYKYSPINCYVMMDPVKPWRGLVNEMYIDNLDLFQYNLLMMHICSMQRFVFKGVPASGYLTYTLMSLMTLI